MELTDKHNFWIRIMIYTFGLILTFDFVDQNQSIKTSTGFYVVLGITVVVAAFYGTFMCKKIEVNQTLV
jgi:putative methionine-R-sulfoxide reductase with GAF domain